LAQSLELSPTTVSAAWALLVRAGTIHPDGRRGTVIAPRRWAGSTRYRQALGDATDFDLDLSSGLPDARLLPDMGPALLRLRAQRTVPSYLEEAVIPELYEALMADWPYPAEAMSLTDGAMDAHAQFMAQMLRYGDRVAVEDPTFPPLLDLLHAQGMRVVGIRLDAQGMRPDELSDAVATGLRAVFIQPRGQNPTGISLTPRRARQLAAVLKGSRALVVENDSAGMVAVSPLLSLGAFLPEQTIHIRSFSKSHSPELRLAAVSGTAEHVAQLAEGRLLGQGWSSRLLQAILLDLLTHKPSQKQVGRARATYARRRTSVVAALRSHGVEVGGDDGLNIWLPVRAETETLVRLASRGIGVAAGGPFTTSVTQPAHVRVTTSTIDADYSGVAAELAAAANLDGWTTRS
jgi:DNA-binding transcriptional MocR family regulator